MKIARESTLLLFAGCSQAFAPAKFGRISSPSKLNAIDPSAFHELPSHIHSLQHAFSSISLADLDSLTDSLSSAPEPAAVVDAVQQALPAVGDPAANVAVEAANNNGWFGFLTAPIEFLLEGIHAALVAVGVDNDAWGVTIIFMTLVIKLVTFPLTKTQLESTNKMQALQPTIKEVQAKYQSNPEVMNQKIAELYQQNDVNPLAGCLPSLVQIPVFIGLYRAVLDLAKENLLDEPFLFLPNLEGPVYGADPTQGSAWLFDNWSNGAPSLGWDDTIAFLILPVFLVVSQFISMELMTPKDQQQQGNIVLKLLPLMIGWFSLNVPAALCLYWVVNNIVTTATSVIIRNSMKTEPVSVGGGSAASAAPTTESIFAPPPLREKPSGFGEGVTPITSAIDAEVVDDDDNDADEAGTGIGEATEPKKSRGKKKKRRKN